MQQLTYKTFIFNKTFIKYELENDIYWNLQTYTTGLDILVLKTS